MLPTWDRADCGCPTDGEWTYHGRECPRIPKRNRRTWKHWLAHLFGLNRGRVNTWYDGNQLWVGFRCTGCGELSSRVKR